METFWSHEFSKNSDVLQLVGRVPFVYPDGLVGLVQDILAEDHTYYNHYAIEFAFKKAMNLDTMAVVHFAISACK